MSSPLAWLLGTESPRCGCTGECGREHEVGGCSVTHPSSLMVAPRDPAMSALTPLSVSEDQQGTWCRDCHDMAARIADARVELRGLVSAIRHKATSPTACTGWKGAA